MERIRENLIKESLMNIRFFAQSEYFNGIHIKDDIILEKGLLANKSDSFESSKSQILSVLSGRKRKKGGYASF